MIEISHVDVDDDETRRLVLEVLASGRLAAGPTVERLEGAFAELAGTRHALAVNSGTAALAAALAAHHIGPGDRVVTSPFTFIATLNTILHTGADVAFVDIADDYIIDPGAVAAACADPVAAVIPVHLYGRCADLAELSAIAQRGGAALIEDAAQAHGASVAGQRAGSVGTGCFSLYATKNVAAGEGGIVTTDDDGVADRVRLLRNQGMRARYQYESIGHNWRMTELAAAVAVPQMARLTERNRQRARNAAQLRDGLADITGLILPAGDRPDGDVWHQFTVRVADEARLNRDQLAERLGAAGVRSGVYYPRLVWEYDIYRDHPQIDVGATPNAHLISRQVLSLPVHHGLPEADVARVIDAVRDPLT